MNNSYLNKQLLRIKQKINALVSNPKFQQEILDLRKKWDIPENGIQTQEHTERWYRKLDKATKDYRKNEWPKFRNELDKLHKPETYGQYRKMLDEINNLIPINAFHLDINLLMKKYKVGPQWHDPIKRYLLFNNPDNMGMSLGVTISKNIDINNPFAEKISIEINEDTTLDDIKAIWPDVRTHQEMLAYKKQKKYQPIKNSERDKRIYELSSEGKTLDQIGDIINIEFNDAMDHNQIGIVLSRYKKRHNIN